MIKTLIDPARVLDLAYSAAEYTPLTAVSLIDIATVERDLLIPVVGEPLYEAIAEGEYPMLLSDYVSPAIALHVRERVNAPTAPSSAVGLRRARSMMLRLSDFLDENRYDYPEYSPMSNILKRCRINGGHVQIH